jgi:hypothetical protein
MKKYKDWSEVPNGTKIKVIRNSNAHNYPLDKILIKDIITYGISSVVIVGHNQLNIDDVIFVAETLEDIEMDKFTFEKNYQELLKEHKNKIEELELKILYMKENDVEVFDETEYKTYQTLKILETTKDLKTKSKLIAQLINN